MFFLLLPLFLSERPTDAQLEGLLNVMTLEEKVGQMSMIAIDLFVNVSTDTLIPEQLQNGIVKYKIGSILNTYGDTSHDREIWSRFIKEMNEYADQNPIKIPIIYGLDSSHGAGYVNNFTSFPQSIGMAATFNLTLMTSVSEAAAYETRAASVHMTFTPLIDLGIDPRWSRLWEGFGEDPYLMGEFGAASVLGFQGSDEIDEKHIASLGKHFMGYSQTQTGKDRTPAYLSESVLREYHLPPFERVIKGGASFVSVNSGTIGGIPTHMNKHLLTDILKDELNFQGVVMTDWQDISNMVTRDRVFSTQKEAVKFGINAGIDMAMIPFSYDFCDNLIELVNEGEVPLERINDAVRRILKLKAKVNLWDVPFTNSQDYPLFGSEKFSQLAFDAAGESITLLKNENSTLPLKIGTKVLVVGPNSNSTRVLNGGWSYSFQGEKAVTHATQYNTILKSIQNLNGFDNVTHVQGVTYNESGKYWEEYEDGIENAVAAANDSDVIVLCLGENSYTEKPGDLSDITISELQERLALRLSETGKPIILVLSEGRPRLITKIEPKVQSILWIYLPGNYGGDALASVLFGEINPSGKLPITYPKYPHSLFPYYRKRFDDYNPLFEFGFGLSYTQFNYSNLDVSVGEVISINVTVTNVGERSGKESVLLYASDLVATTSPDFKRLKRFTKISLEPGESQVVAFELTTKDLSFINEDNQRVTEPGDFEISVGGLTHLFTLA